MQPSRTLIVSDLDGTLLRSDKSLSMRTLSALGSARSAGFRTAVASARPLRLVEEVLGGASALFDALIVSNGAAVMDASSRVTLHEHRLAHEQCSRIIELVRSRWPEAAFGWELGTLFAGDPRFLELVTRQRILRDPVAAEVAEAPRNGVHQLVAAVPGVAPYELVAPITALLGAECSVTESNGGVVEISPAVVTKAEGAEWWARSLGAGLSEVIAFGDELNDIPLLSRAGIGYAMANAADYVRAHAHATTSASNDDDGVARVLEDLVAAVGEAS